MPDPVAGTISLPSRVNSAIRYPSGQPLAQSHARPCSCLLALQGSLRVLYSSLALRSNIHKKKIFYSTNKRRKKAETDRFPKFREFSRELFSSNESQCTVAFLTLYTFFFCVQKRRGKIFILEKENNVKSALEARLQGYLSETVETIFCPFKLRYSSEQYTIGFQQRQ